MITFKTVETAGPLRVVQVGAGGMGKAWIRTLQANDDVELVGLVDFNLGVPRRPRSRSSGCGMLHSARRCRRWRTRPGLTPA